MQEEWNEKAILSEIKEELKKKDILSVIKEDIRTGQWDIDHGCKLPRKVTREQALADLDKMKKEAERRRKMGLE